MKTPGRPEGNPTVEAGISALPLAHPLNHIMIPQAFRQVCGDGCADSFEKMGPQGHGNTIQQRKEDQYKTMDRQEFHRQIDHVFRDLLPAVGMTEREEQIALCHRLLDTMLNGGIALCDAGTGIGKTHAYLVAGLVFLRYRSFNHMKFCPIMISTSNIALQTELQRDYIPQLAQVLNADGWNINPSELSVIRKGKRHYVCEQQLERRLREMSRRSPKRRGQLLALLDEIDLDAAETVSGYDKRLIQVYPVCARCRRKH